jgi:hypothetical protein
MTRKLQRLEDDGRYDNVLQAVRDLSQAEGFLLVILRGHAGNAVLVDMDHEDVPGTAKVLRAVSDDIDGALKRELAEAPPPGGMTAMAFQTTIETGQPTDSDRAMQEACKDLGDILSGYLASAPIKGFGLVMYDESGIACAANGDAARLALAFQHLAKQLAAGAIVTPAVDRSKLQ